MAARLVHGIYTRERGFEMGEKMDVLKGQALSAAAEKIPGWTVEERGLERFFQFTDFKAALEFVNRVGAIAEAEGHHPDIYIRYNNVRLGLVTHDSGGVTSRDLAMAELLSRDLPY